MSDKTELENFLERSVTPEVVEDKAEPETEEAAAEADTTPEVADKGEKHAETPSAEKGSTANASKHWSETAYLDEKRKRQELEERLAALEKPKAKEDVDLFADPEGFKKSLRDEMKTEAFSIRAGISRDLLMETKPDYEAKEAKFLEMAKADPSLAEKLKTHANPAKFAYETAAKQIALDEIGDPVAYREKLKQELLAELNGSKPADKPAKQPIEKAPSLATASAAGSNTSVVKKSLEDMFER
jgi:hypothetical protein